MLSKEGNVRNGSGRIMLICRLMKKFHHTYDFGLKYTLKRRKTAKTSQAIEITFHIWLLAKVSKILGRRRHEIIETQKNILMTISSLGVGRKIRSKILLCFSNAFDEL
jgi:hypothetical protein